jgi:hypothetical protein
MDARELLHGHERVWKTIYSWKSIRHRLKGKKSNRSLLWAANAAYRYYARRLHKFYNCDAGLV